MQRTSLVAVDMLHMVPQMPRAEPAPRTAAASTVTIKEAAEYLGVSEVTLRRWDDAGKFTATRHPINGYRLYRVKELERLKRTIDGHHGAER